MCHGQCVDVKLLMNQLTRHKFVKTKVRERRTKGNDSKDWERLAFKLWYGTTFVMSLFSLQKKMYNVNNSKNILNNILNFIISIKYLFIQITTFYRSLTIV